jgi:hypothetical protein
MIRAYVHENYTGFNVDISVVMHPAEGSMDVRPRIMRLAGTGGCLYATWEEIPADGTIEGPTFRLGHEEARAILDALTAHFHGDGDTRALRRDYDAERKRVDQLAGTLSTLALKLAEPARLTQEGG